MFELLAGGVVAGLATYQTINVWRNGSIFAGWRARVELWDNWLGELLSCALCASVWVGFLAAIAVLLPADSWLAWPGRVAVVGLAASGIADILRKRFFASDEYDAIATGGSHDGNG